LISRGRSEFRLQTTPLYIGDDFTGHHIAYRVGLTISKIENADDAACAAAIAKNLFLNKPEKTVVVSGIYQLARTNGHVI
jgi:hypothetical protein